MQMNADTDIAYHLLQVAQQKFAATPAALNTEQRRQATRIARKKRQIESAVLGSMDAAGVVVADSRIDDALNSIRERYATTEELDAALQEAGLDEETLRVALMHELQVEQVLDKISAAVAPVSETDARLYYYMHPEEFQRPEVRTARHILITINPDFPENQREAALQRIQTIAARIDRKPHRFAEQALKHSECPTSLNGGLLGNVTRGNLYPELEAVLFGLDPGQMSDVIESPLGFHLLWCDSIDPAREVTFDEILPALRQQLDARQRSRYQRAWLEALLKATSESTTGGRVANG